MMMVVACIVVPLVVCGIIVASIWSSWSRAASYSKTLHQCYGPDH